MRRKRLGAVSLLPLLALAAGAVRASAPADPVFGHWLTENQRAIVEIQPCGESACGHFAWLADPRDETGRVKTDVNGMPLCDLRLVRDFRRDKPGRWIDGRIYNPRDGNEYGAEMTLQPDGTLEVRGYRGLVVFGKSQIWTPVPDDRGGCRSSFVIQPGNER